MEEPFEINLWLAAAIVILSLVLSAFFAGAETAFTAASRARMLALENNGDLRAAIVNRLLGQRERFIGAMLIGYNIVAIGASSFTTSVLIARRTIAMSAGRPDVFFCRHRRSSSRILAGVFGGNAFQSGSRSRTAAIVPGTVSAAKARFPVSNS